MERGELVGLVGASVATVLAELSAELAGGEATPTEATPLLGEGSDLDSLGLVMFVVDVEQQLRKRGFDLRLADALILPHEENPFGTIGTLADYLVTQLNRTG